MTRTDHQIIFTALGFLAVILREDVPRDKQALRATTIAGLIESFCQSSLPEVFIADGSVKGIDTEDLDRAISQYKPGVTSVPHDRRVLIQLYDRLLLRKAHNNLRDFFETSSDNEIADLVLGLLQEEEILAPKEA